MNLSADIILANQENTKWSRLIFLWDQLMIQKQMVIEWTMMTKVVQMIIHTFISIIQMIITSKMIQMMITALKTILSVIMRIIIFKKIMIFMYYKKALMVYYIRRRLCIYYFGLFLVFPFSHPIPAFYANIPAFCAEIPCYSCSVCCTARSERVGGWGSHAWRGFIPGLVCVFIQACDLTRQPNSQFRIPVQIYFPQGTEGLSSADHMWVRSRDRDCNLSVYPNRTCKRGYYIFSAMVWLNCASTSRASLPSIPSTERTNGENCFRWLLQCLPFLSFLIVYHQSRSAAIGSYLYESVSAFSSLTSMMDWTCQYHKPWIMTSPFVSLSLSLPWRISFSDIF